MSSPLPRSAHPQGRIRVQRIAEAAVERARLTVVPRRRTRVRAPRVPFVTLVSLLLVAGVVGLLMFNTSMQQNSFQVSAMEAQAAELASRQQTLEMRLDELRDPQRLGEWARDRGMVQPSSAAFLLPDGTVLGSPAAAVPNDTFDPRTPAARKPAVLDRDPIIVREKPKNRDGGRRGQDAGTAGRTRGDTERAPANRRG